jgi:hypothetical protein
LGDLLGGGGENHDVRFALPARRAVESIGS